MRVAELAIGALFRVRLQRRGDVVDAPAGQAGRVGRQIHGGVNGSVTNERVLLSPRKSPGEIRYVGGELVGVTVQASGHRDVPSALGGGVPGIAGGQSRVR